MLFLAIVCIYLFCIRRVDSLVSSIICYFFVSLCSTYVVVYVMMYVSRDTTL